MVPAARLVDGRLELAQVWDRVLRALRRRKIVSETRAATRRSMTTSAPNTAVNNPVTHSINSASDRDEGSGTVIAHACAEIPRARVQPLQPHLHRVGQVGRRDAQVRSHQRSTSESPAFCAARRSRDTATRFCTSSGQLAVAVGQLLDDGDPARPLRTPDADAVDSFW